MSRQPRPAAPNIETLREALHQRAETWKADLRAEPKVARLVVRRLVEPIELWNDAVPAAACTEWWADWEASVSPALLDGLVHHGTSPTGTEDGWATPVHTRVKAA